MSAGLGRYRGTRMHTESDLRVFLRWSTDRGLDPLAAARVDIERCMRWLRPSRRRVVADLVVAVGEPQIGA